MLCFLCESLTEDRRYLLEIKYEVSTGIWILYKIE